MKLIKTASGDTIIKMSKYEWVQIGKTAGWFTFLCSYCKGKLWSKKKNEIHPDAIKDKTNPHFGDVEDLGVRGTYIIHGLCNICGRILYPELEKKNPGVFLNPINDRI